MPIYTKPPALTPGGNLATVIADMREAARQGLPTPKDWVLLLSLCGSAEHIATLLGRCREVVAEARDLVVESHCRVDLETLGPLLDTLDEEAKPWVDEFDRLLADIDAAIGAPEPGDCP